MDSNKGIVATSEILAAFQSKIEAKTAQVGIIGPAPRTSVRSKRICGVRL